MKKQVTRIICVASHEQMISHLEEAVKGLPGNLVIARNESEAIAQIERWAPYLGLIVVAHDEEVLNAYQLREKTIATSKEIPYVVMTPFITKKVALSSTDYKISKFVKATTEVSALHKVFEEESKSRIQSIEDDNELVDDFINDTENLLEELEDLTMNLENDSGNMEIIDRISAIIHTIKGTSAFFKPDTISQFSHHLEDFLSPYKKQLKEITSTEIAVVLKATDVIRNLIGKLKELHPGFYQLNDLLSVFKEESAVASPQTTQVKEPKPTAVPEDPGQKSKTEIKVNIELLEEFLELSGRITIIRNMMDKVMQNFLKVKSSDHESVLLLALIEEMHKINNLMQLKIDDIRKVPMSQVYRPINRVVSDLRRKLNKKIELVLSGDNIRIDASIAEVLNNSLVHMIRNCIDHGIEMPDERLAKGKSETGEIRLDCHVLRDDIIVELSDNGKGINPEVIRRKLKEKELFPVQEIDQMNEKQLINMIFAPGFSTAAQVTEVSGRGVGMDMVKKSTEKIGGSIEIDSILDQGSRFKLILPTPRSVLVMNGLNVLAKGVSYFIPQERIFSLTKINREKDQERFQMLRVSSTIMYNGHPIPVDYLSRVLEGGVESEKNHQEYFDQHADISLVILDSGGHFFGLIVDNFFDFEDLTIKRLPSLLSMADVFLGVSFLGDSELGLILNVDQISSRLKFNQTTTSQQQSQNKQLQNKQNSSSVNRDHSPLVDIKSEDSNSYFTFSVLNRIFAVPLRTVYRIENIPRERVNLCSTGDIHFIFEGKSIGLIPMDQVWLKKSLIESPILGRDFCQTILISNEKGVFGLVVDVILDLYRDVPLQNSDWRDERGFSGTLIINDQVVSLLDPNQILQFYNQAAAFN